jgi:hypothetical protein
LATWISFSESLRESARLPVFLNAIVNYFRGGKGEKLIAPQKRRVPP